MDCSGSDESYLLHHSLSLVWANTSDRRGSLLIQERLNEDDSTLGLLSVSCMVFLVFWFMIALIIFFWKDDRQDASITSKPASVTGLEPSSVALGMLGSMLELYDFGLYGIFTVEIGEAFFRGQEELDTIFLTFATFACGFLMRPIGAILWGYVGDSYGRVVALKLGLAGMVCSTSVIGVLPPRRSIGIAAPILVIIMRMVQGLSAGGQLPGSFVYMLERARPDRRCLVNSLVSLSMTLGMMLSSAVAYGSHGISTDTPWRWRLPFCLAAIPGAIAWYAGSQAEESDEFNSVQRSSNLQQHSFLVAFYANWRTILRIGSCAAFQGILFYTLYTWMPIYERELRPPPALPHALGINTVCLAVLSIMTLFWGWLADYAKYDRVLLYTMCLIGMISGPTFLLFDRSQPGMVFAAYLLLSIPYGLVGSMQSRWAFELVPDVGLRCVTICTSYSVFMAVFGGTGPYIQTILQASWGILAPGLYISALGFLCAFAIASA